MTVSNTLFHAWQNQLKSAGRRISLGESWTVEMEEIRPASLIGKMISGKEKPKHFMGLNIEKKNISCRLAS